MLLLPRAVPVLGAVAVLGVLPGLASAPSPPVNVVPVLTSIPFGAGPGQRVTHTITLSSSGTGTVPAVRITYTTTVDLGSAAARTSSGKCAVNARTAVCDLGNLRFPIDPAKSTITITGTVDPKAAPGTLVQNRVSVDSPQFTTKSANQVASNAYLVSNVAASGQSTAPSHSVAAAPLRSAPRTNHGPLLTMIVVVCVAAIVGGLFLWRRRQRRLVTASPGQSET